MSSNQPNCSTTAARTALSLLATLLLAAVPVAGCATAPGDGEDPNTGELLLQLVQPGPHGEIYHLSNATFDIVDGTGATTTVTDSGISAQVKVSLPPGIARVTLRDGWTLEKSTDGGSTFAPVGALLGSLNPNIVRVLANNLVFVEFDFLIRETNGTLSLTLGIIANPRELGGGILIQTATDGLAQYAVSNRTLDFGVFFNLLSLERQTLDDGTKQLVYTAFGQQGSFGPVPLPAQAVAGEFYNDRLGVFSGPIKTDLVGAFLTYTVAAKPDGTIQLNGTLAGGFNDFEFGPNAIDVVVPTLDADGFPNDQFWYDSTLPFTLTGDQGTASGLFRMRHLPPAN
jgi:predicted small secreted protein